MANSNNSLNTRFLADVPPPTRVIFHSSQLKAAYIDKQRMDFLNYHGQDYFAKQCDNKTEKEQKERWQDQADRRYPVEGDYLVEVETGFESFIDLQNSAPIDTCSRFLWIKEGLDPNLTVSTVFTDCDCQEQKIEAKVEELEEPLAIRAFNTPVVSNGAIIYIESSES